MRCCGKILTAFSFYISVNDFYANKTLNLFCILLQRSKRWDIVKIIRSHNIIGSGHGVNDGSFIKEDKSKLYVSKKYILRSTAKLSSISIWLVGGGVNLFFTKIRFVMSWSTNWSWSSSVVKSHDNTSVKHRQKDHHKFWLVFSDYFNSCTQMCF